MPPGPVADRVPPGVFAPRLRFDRFVLDLDRGSVLQGDREIALRRKTFEFLCYLATHSGRLISKDELLAALWPKVVVSEDSVVQCVTELRRALGDHDQRLIRTVPGRGYRFEASIDVEPEPPPAQASAATASAASSQAARSPARRRARLALGTIALLALVATSLTAWWWPGVESPMHAAPPFSIVVLPFKQLGDDPDQDHFAEGVTHDLSTELARLPGLFVIAHATARTLKDKAIDARQLGRELKVRYLLEGSVRRSGDQARINVQLIDAGTGASVWAQRFTRRSDEASAWQDEVVGSVTTALNFRLTRLESERGVRERRASPAAWDLSARGWALVYSAKRPQTYFAARSLFEQALERDPEAVSALAGIAWTNAVIVLDHWSRAPEQDLAAAEAAATRTLALDPEHFVAHQVRGFLFRIRGRPDAAREAFRTAIAINPNYAPGHAQVGAAELALGDPDAAIVAVQRAIRLSPRDPSLGPWFALLGKAELHRGNDRQAASWLARAIDTGTPLAHNHAYLASALARSGRLPEARAAVDEFRRRAPSATIGSLRADARSTEPRFLAQQERFFEGLRLAGLAE